MKKIMKMLLGFLLVVMFSGMFSPVAVLAAKDTEDVPMNKTSLVPYDKKWEKEVKNARKELAAKGVKLPWKKFQSRKRIKHEDLAYIFYHAYKDTIPVEDPWSTGAIYNVKEGSSKYWKEIHWAVDVELLFLAYPDPFSGKEPEEFLFRRQLYMSSGDVFFYFKGISKKLGVEKLPKKKKIFKFNDEMGEEWLLFDDITLYPEDHPWLIELLEAGVATKRVDGSIGYYENATQGDLVVYLNRFMNLDLRLCPLEYQKKMTEMTE